MLIPTIADSEIGVSTTRMSPNSSYRPCVTPNAPPYAPTSSPRTNTFGSRRISSASASRIASRYVTSRIEIRRRLRGGRVGCVRRVIDRLVDRGLDLPFDLRLLRIVEDVAGAQIGGEGRNRIAALPHRELFVGAVERLVVFGVAVPAVRLALDQRRPVAAARARERARGRLVDRQHVVAVDRDA